MPTASPKCVFVSAGESSGELYAAELVARLKRDWPATHWFGCAGPRMQAQGVEPVVDTASLAVVGIVEVVSHLPRIFGEYRKLLKEIRQRRPAFVILTDSPDFHLRLAAKVHAMGIPVIYLVAPQAWAWRQGRARQMSRTLTRLLCLFPFEETWYRQRGVAAEYIGHPLAKLVKPAESRQSWRARRGFVSTKPLVVLCPGSRVGEVGRHLATLVESTTRINETLPCQFALALPQGFRKRAGEQFFRERKIAGTIQVIEGETWDAMAHADLVLAASGTVTVEAALLGTPMVTYYKVTALSWLLGRWLVKVPHLTMVNLIAGRRVVPELMQNEMTAERLSAEALKLLTSQQASERMRRELEDVRAKLASEQDPMERAARIVKEFFDEQRTNH
ncbi:MAG: lipid-A-disaccharide synthase [Bryobacteraceae bacterium]|nr:lipid-A-disaccharide synthase [Bryobacteraceae bacterium]